jgi:hypothetical protein
VEEKYIERFKQMIKSIPRENRVVEHGFKSQARDLKPLILQEDKASETTSVVSTPKEVFHTFSYKSKLDPI